MLCWKAFLDADDDSVTALTDLGSTEHPTEGVIAGIEKLVFLLYKPITRITNVKDLRWLLFRKSQAQSRETAANSGFTKGVNIAGTSLVHGMAQ